MYACMYLSSHMHTHTLYIYIYNILNTLYIYIYIIDIIFVNIPLVPHKAVAKVSKIGNL